MALAETMGWSENRLSCVWWRRAQTWRSTGSIADSWWVDFQHKAVWVRVLDLFKPSLLTAVVQHGGGHSGGSFHAKPSGRIVGLQMERGKGNIFRSVTEKDSWSLLNGSTKQKRRKHLVGWNIHKTSISGGAFLSTVSAEQWKHSGVNGSWVKDSEFMEAARSSPQNHFPATLERLRLTACSGG